MIDFINPVIVMAEAFLDIWYALPDPFRSLSFIVLMLTVVYSLYQILSR